MKLEVQVNVVVVSDGNSGCQSQDFNFILAENGDILNAENGDKLTKE